MSTVEQIGITAAEFLDRDECKSFELVDGELLGKTIGGESSHIAALLIAYLGQVVLKDDLGHVFGSDCGFQCFGSTTGDENRVRRPDVSFVAKGRLDQSQYQAGFISVVPDLAVEVVSPNDKASELNSKLEEYLQAGVQQVWILQPTTKTIDIHASDGSVRRLHSDETLTAEPMIPGFECPVSNLFPTLSK